MSVAYIFIKSENLLLCQFKNCYCVNTTSISLISLRIDLESNLHMA